MASYSPWLSELETISIATATAAHAKEITPPVFLVVLLSPIRASHLTQSKMICPQGGTELIDLLSPDPALGLLGVIGPPRLIGVNFRMLLQVCLVLTKTPKHILIFLVQLHL